jgi:hypothetical protein
MADSSAGGAAVNGISLRSVGVHLNGNSGLLTLVAHDVVLDDGAFPEVTVGYAFAGQGVSDIPETCRAQLTVDGVSAGNGFGMDILLRGSNGEQLRTGGFVDWEGANLVLRDCGALTGDFAGFGAVFPGVPVLPADTAKDVIWELLPLFYTGTIGADINLALPLRLPSRVLSASTGARADESFLVVGDEKPTDPLSDEFDELTLPLERSTKDRPDDHEDTAQLKFIYVVPSFAEDRARDTSGEISRFAFQINEWWAAQNAGFGLRLDTYKGALDVGYLRVDMSPEEWAQYFEPRAPFNNGLSRVQDLLADAGWGNVIVKDPRNRANNSEVFRNKLYMLVFEAPAGVYARTGQDRECTSLTDAINDGVSIIGFPMATKTGSSCGQLDASGRYPISGALEARISWVQWKLGGIDHVAQWMRQLPGCGAGRSPRDGERVKIPGVLDPSRAWEIRGGFMRDLAAPNDPTSDHFMSGKQIAAVPALDPRHDLYFHITSDKLATSEPCNSDISRHPLWNDKPFDSEASVSQSRTSYDRPDEIEGAQLKAVYAIRNGATDRRFDVTGDIEKSLLHMRQFVEEQTAGENTVRIDTFNGRPDVMYFPLPPSLTPGDDALCDDEPCPNDQKILAAMRAAGRVQSDKQYIIFYDGGIEFNGKSLCGGSASNSPASFINLSGVTSQMCEFLPFASTPTTQWSVGLLALHEVFHALGAVCERSSVSSEGMHSTVPNDIMNGRAQGNVQLDPSRAYWYSNSSGCPTLSENALFRKG